MASVSAEYINNSADPIPTSYQTLHVRYSTRPDFVGYREETFVAQTVLSRILTWSYYSLTGLQAGMTYYWLAYLDLFDRDAQTSGSFTTLSGVTATKYVYYNGVQQPGLTEQESGLSPGGTYTPKLHQPSVGAGYTLDHILYNGTDVTNSAITCPSNDFGLHYYYVSDAGVWIYNNGWKKAVPWIYNNGWKRATAFIYDGGWKQGG